MTPTLQMPVFHAMENFFANLPRYGRFSSTPWKIPANPCPSLSVIRPSEFQVSSFTPLPPAPFQPSIIPILNHMNRLPPAA
jgi:hypothetical protein